MKVAGLGWLRRTLQSLYCQPKDTGHRYPGGRNLMDQRKNDPSNP